MLKTSPAVFAVGKNYQIMVPVTENSLFWVEIDGKCYYDEQNGIMRSLCTTHRVSVPTEALDKAGKYTVCERVIIDRKPYFPITADTVRTDFDFRPIPIENVRIYHVADTHNNVDAPVAAANVFGNIDLLVMNGDVPDHSGEIKNFDTIYEIAAKITHGNIPIVFARGNHDLRGYHAEEIADHTPNLHGYTYYSFRLGEFWGLVLDCGEDKMDYHAEYGLTVACHPFRERQTEFIRDIIKSAESEYAAEGVKYRLIICHNPFTFQLKPPFNIEEEIYREWARLIKDSIKPTLMLCGHLHETFISPVGSERDHLGQMCPLVVGSDIKRGEKTVHTGCGLVFSENAVDVTFCTSEGNKTSEKIEI